MKHKLLALAGASLFILVSGLFSCGWDCGPFHTKFNVVGLEWHNFKAIYDVTSENKLMLSEIETDSVAYNQYAINIQPEIETYSAQTMDRWDFSLIQSAYACDPPTLTTDETIDSIVIVAETDFDLTHSSGIDLSDLFDIVIRDDASGKWFEKYDLDDYLATHPNVPTNMTLILKERPGVTSDFEFLVKYYQKGLGTNDYFEFTTDKVVITRE